jgi:replicative DNA helicase
MDAETKAPPSDIAAEAAVIGSALVAFDKAWPLVSGLAVDDFFFPAHREAWAAILAVVERRMPVDVLSVGDEVNARGVAARFDGGWGAWAPAAANSIPTVANVGHYAKIVQDKATLRQLIQVTAEVQGAAYAGQPVEDVMARAREGVAKLEVSGTHGGLVKVGELLSGALSEIERRMLGEIPVCIPTGIKALDDILGGGWKPGRLYYVGGRPGDGKTAFAKRITRHAALKGFPAAMFSRETPNQETIEGHLSVASRVPAFDISSGRLNYEKFCRIQSAANSLYEPPLYLDDTSSTIELICANMRKFVAMVVRKIGPKALGLMVLDYLQLARIRNAKSGANREQYVAEMSRTLKELAMKLGIPVVVLTQLKREAEERGGRPMPSDCRESGSIEQDGDVVMFVYRDIPPEDKVTRNQPGPGELIVGKHRGGATGIADAYFESTLMNWRDRDDYQPRRDEPDTRGDIPQDWNERGER